MNSKLIAKYNVPVPRYTSYPTVPNWSGEINVPKWQETVENSFKNYNENGGVSIYIHLPYCEDLCTYCGCNKRITKNHRVETPYIETLLKEWEMYKTNFKGRPVIEEIHLGGGTPTFFSDKNLVHLITYILDGCTVSKSASFSFEAHPANTTLNHLVSLSEIGFRRVSYGIQDFDLKVQKAINRYQSYKTVEKTVSEARRAGYDSINFDLVYGLPFQTIESLKNTLEQTILLNPDRIAYYSYAHVPWTAKGQRAYNENDLPSPEDKLAMYHLGQEFLVANGYENIGMDHYAKKTDEMYICQQAGSLHRNFMGYTTNNSKILIGLGVSAISDLYDAYSQNHKTIPEYQKAIENQEFPIHKQHYLDYIEVSTRQSINNLMCSFKTKLDLSNYKNIVEQGQEALINMEADGLVYWKEGELYVTETGKQYVRNISATLDKSYWAKQTKQVFSQSV